MSQQFRTLAIAQLVALESILFHCHTVDVHGLVFASGGDNVYSNMASKNDGLDRIPFELTETDRENLAAGDEKFQPHDWKDLKRIIGGMCCLFVSL